MSWIKSFRLELGISMTDMARILDIKRTTLSAIESGRLKLPKSAEAIVFWIDENRHQFVPADTTPAPQPELLRKDLKKIRVEKDNLILALEKRQEREKKLLQTSLLCKCLVNDYPNPTRKLILNAGSIGYNSELDFEKLQTNPTQRMIARIAGIEAEIQALEKEIGGDSD